MEERRTKTRDIQNSNAHTTVKEAGKCRKIRPRTAGIEARTREGMMLSRAPNVTRLREVSAGRDEVPTSRTREPIARALPQDLTRGAKIRTHANDRPACFDLYVNFGHELSHESQSSATHLLSRSSFFPRTGIGDHDDEPIAISSPRDRDFRSHFGMLDGVRGCFMRREHDRVPGSRRHLRPLEPGMEVTPKNAQ